jgi:hypothetical protein
MWILFGFGHAQLRLAGFGDGFTQTVALRTRLETNRALQVSRIARHGGESSTRIRAAQKLFDHRRFCGVVRARLLRFHAQMRVEIGIEKTLRQLTASVGTIIENRTASFSAMRGAASIGIQHTVAWTNSSFSPRA